MTGRIRVCALAVIVLATSAAGCASSNPARPDATLRDVDLRLQRYEGGTFHLSGERGRVVMLNFFATWCAPCVLEIPYLVELQERFGPDGLTVIGISMDQVRPMLDQFMEQVGVGFPVVFADSSMYAGETPFGQIHTLPTTIVIDRSGAVVAAQAGVLDPAATESFVQRLLLTP